VDPDGFPLTASFLPHLQDYYNRKGLVSEKGEKKKAYTTELLPREERAILAHGSFGCGLPRN
jgi:hypothetical protein